ncbi:hypothetical protein HK102_005519 [Quaeritorhiza haematococci]|nr:hypothetical protein HK102_005519 [Quaeritorhiza haematococci]
MNFAQHAIFVLASVIGVVASPLPNAAVDPYGLHVSNITQPILTRRNPQGGTNPATCGRNLQRPCRQQCSTVGTVTTCEEFCFGAPARFRSFNDKCRESDVAFNKQLSISASDNFANLPDISYVGFPAPDAPNVPDIPRLSPRTKAILSAPGAQVGVCYTGIMVLAANSKLIYMWPLVPRPGDTRCRPYTATNVVQPFQVPPVDQTGHDFIFRQAQQESGASNVPRDRVLGFALQDMVLDFTSGTFNCGRRGSATPSVPNPTCAGTGQRLMGRQYACMLFNVLLARMQLTTALGAPGTADTMFDRCNAAYPWFINDRNV